MKQVFGNLWTEEADARCVTTNSVLTARGEAVMGAGCAREARDRIPGLAQHFGTLLSKHGHRVMRIGRDDTGADIISFPTKNHWRDKSDIVLIEKSCHQLLAVADKFGYQKVLLPRPGVNNGWLSWHAQVKPVVERILGNDPRITVIATPGEEY